MIYSQFIGRTYVQKVLLLLIFVTLVLIASEYLVYTSKRINNNLHNGIQQNYFLSSRSIYEHNMTVNNYYKKRENWTTSKLGLILFKDKKYGVPRENKTFVVLIWKYWNWLKSRHIQNYNSKRNDPLEYCSVKNCKFTGENNQLGTADAVVIHMQHGLIPDGKNRNTNQRWIFLNDESPLHSFTMAKVKPKLSDLANIFNWSMTYRSDADIPVPYGRTISLKEPLADNLTSDTLAELIPNWNKKRRDIHAVVLISNCVSWRMEYLKKLQNFIDIDIIGKCSTLNKKTCPGHFKSDCDMLSEYIFYFSFENSFCSQYLTEKIFQNAYSKGAIPVILGPSIEDCEQLLPPMSYIHTDNFDTPEKLASELIHISQNNETIFRYHRWRNDFEVVNEHGYFGTKSYHYCRVCEALNYNDDSPTVYDEESLRLFLDPMLTCRKK
ncbi:4-galactosyl-N-acetylglucosaminide 3-alpha-L-fucosyltransferase 9-like [Achroia grisella]|uniref:4-galactosyl-N-acetylglucosaminide 3-alpha-L-fucosyltransferase 9-like n=1 Tax=Achroia grisella TaxID=688607 RepID=UPI0027D29B19|nr:4-galactosyl-N-acetylglucosaminide 3-alpha-L-fucosyltransferase 9-like [Achroia grisella]